MSNAWNWTVRLGEIAVVGTLVAGAVGVAISTVGMVAAERMSAETRSDLACLVGVAEPNTPAGEACIATRMAPIIAAHEDQLARDRAAHEARMAEAAEALAQIERRARAAMSTTRLIYQRLGEVDGRYIFMAVAYDDPATRTGFIGRWCFAARDTSGPDPRLLISTYDAMGAVTGTLRTDGQDPQAFGLSPAGVVEARRLCDGSPSGG